MKKIFLFASAVVAMLAAGSCQKEVEFLEGDTVVKFEVSAGDVATKAIADATNITVLHWELYGTDIATAAAPYGEGTVTETDRDKNFTVELRLVADQDYNIVFWAETEHGATHYDTQDLRSVKIKTYGDENANDESRAAFFAVHNFQTENGVSVNEQVTLYRPFAQINLGTTTYETDLNQINGGQLAVESTQMTVTRIANVFNTLDGVGEVVDFSGEVTFKAAATPNGDADKTQQLLKVNENTYYWIGMNYLIVEGDSDAIDVDVTLNTNMGTISHSVANVPVKENYRTNILGDFLTTGATFEIVVDETFQTPDQVVSMWDGSVEEPEFDAATDTYEIGSAAELAWFAAAVNGKLPDTKAVPAPNTFAGKTVKVVADIDLQGAPWTPIGYWETFEGIFDGGDHTIRNLNVTATEADCYLGLFGCTDNATIKNVKIHNAVVKATVGDNEWAGGHLGALVGYPDGTTVIENITLTGDIKIEGPMDKKAAQRIGAVVGGFKAQALTLSNVTVNASEGSYVKGNLYVGGVVGQPVCPVTMTNVVSNIDVYSQDGMVGGIAGYVMPNSTLTNCSSTGNVYRVSAAGTENQVKRIGGILGSWESSYGKVVLDECAFEGALYVAGTEYTDYLYGGLVGRAANTDADAKGVIVINGLTFISEGLAVDAEDNLYAFSAAGLQEALDAAAEGTTTVSFGQNLVGDVIVKQTEGKNIVIDGKEYNYDGTIYIWGNARSNGAETLDIKNVNFKHAEGSIDFISSNSTASAERYAHNVTIEGCTFEGGANAVAARFRQAFNIAIKDSEVIAGHSLAQLNGCSGVAIEGTTVKAGRGVSFGTSTDCTVFASTFEADSYGLRADGTAEGSLSVSNTTIKANQPVIVRKMTDKYAVTLETPVLNTTAPYQVVFTNGADDAEYVVPTGKFTLTGAEGICVYPVANADSFAAAVANEGLAVVDLEGAVENVGLGFKIERDVILNMNGHEFNAGSTAQSTWYALEAYGEHNVEINDANLTRAGIFAGTGADVVFNSGVINHKPERTSRYIFCARNAGTTITIKDGTFKNDRAKNSFFWADGGAVIYVEGGNFTGVASNNKVYTSNGGQVIITGGTFNFDPTAWVAEGCTVTKSGSTWNVSQY